jgi:hypothetical protein
MDASVSSGLGLYFFVMALMNIYFTYRQLAVTKRHVLGGIWLVFTLYLFGTGVEFARGNGPVLSQGFRDLMDYVMGPVTYFLLSIVGFVVVLVFRKFFVNPTVAWVLLNLSLLLIGFSMTDSDFRAIVAKPDNVPISILIYSVGFTTWLAFKQAVDNDERIAGGKKPIEAEGSEKVLTWPDLVYTELLAMVLGTVFLIVWSIMLTAPLEPPAATTKIPNPSKAPWYFLGLQEMLVYFDPWLAGVVLPTYILLGLCAIPYIDYNKKGNGYYTFNERKLAVTTFLFGFIPLWVTLIVLGTFLRGPNWNFFGFYEEWSPYKTIALNNVNLSDYIWIGLLNQARPSQWLIRELPGIVLVLGYFLVVPVLLAKTVMRELFIKMGLVRFMTMANILLMMAFLPLKMVLRWTFNLKYLVYIPEFFFNI